jgi:hypothetical protein
MSENDLILMSSAWTGGDKDARESAWSKVRETSTKDARSEELKESRDRLAQWVNDLGITWVGAYERSILVPQGIDQGNLRRNAVPAILDAIVAVLFESELTEDERDELLEPMRRVTDPETEDE